MKRFAILLLTLTIFVATPLFAAQQTSSTQSNANSTAAVAATINLNTASTAELESLPGIGKTAAANIVAYRTEKGKFKNKQDVVKVKGIGDKTFAKIQHLINVE